MKDLIERIECCLEYSGDEALLQTMFSETEWNILCGMKAYKQILRQMEDIFPLEETTDKKMETELERMDYEKETVLYLKNQITLQLDVLLAAGTVEAWCEILVWYRFVIQDKLVTRFWEFYVLKIVLNIFVEECNKSREGTGTISVLELHSMEELINVYFKTVFLLRRIEYGIEPMDEFAAFLTERKLSDVFVQGVLKEAQIHNKEKVKKVVWGVRNGVG